MNAYATAPWQNFFIAEVGAAAALTGLLFVAVSINLKQILSFPTVPKKHVIAIARNTFDPGNLPYLENLIVDDLTSDVNITFEDGKLKHGTLSAISFARQALPAVGGAITILVLGANTGAAAAELSGYGAAKILCVEDASLAHYTAEHYAPSVAAAAQGSSLVVATASSFGKDLLPRVAARLGATHRRQGNSWPRCEPRTLEGRTIEAGSAGGHANRRTLAKAC